MNDLHIIQARTIEKLLIEKNKWIEKQRKANYTLRIIDVQLTLPTDIVRWFNLVIIYATT